MKSNKVHEWLNSESFEEVPEPINTLWIRPHTIEDNMCFAFNHLGEDIKQQILSNVATEDVIFLIHPCAKEECYIKKGRDEEENEL